MNEYLKNILKKQGAEVFKSDMGILPPDKKTAEYNNIKINDQICPY